jgi:non-specific serine/threonine protein kinase
LLRQHRLTTGLTQEELAELAGLGRRGIQNLERGMHQPQRETLARLSAALALGGAERECFEAAARPSPRYRAGPSHVPHGGPADDGRAGTPRHNLPLPLTSFIGRKKELTELTGWLRDPTGPRLLTLTGAGGCGKTRLALELARALTRDVADGIWLIDLAPLADPERVTHTIAAVVGIREVTQEPIMVTLIRVLAPKRALLVLDNCEHLVDACARATQELLARCPHLTIVVTSREALRIAGEVTWRVPSLSVPPPNARPASTADPVSFLAPFEAAQLFLARTLAIRPSFAVVSSNVRAIAEICRRLDGIPLAIELAAARLGTFSVEQLAARLDQRFQILRQGQRTALPRHQTLAALIGWSYDLLSEPQRILFNRLAVFAGGWTLSAAEAICSADPLATEDIPDVLGQICDKSLALADIPPGDGETRYRLLESLREYARERLNASVETNTMRARHAAYHLSLAEQAQAQLRGPRQVDWYSLLDRERDNMRAALQWLLQHHDAQASLRLGAAIWKFWQVRGPVSEGRQRLSEILALSETSAPTSARAMVLFGLAEVAMLQGDFEEATSRLEQCLAIARELEERRVASWALQELGFVEFLQCHYTAARPLVEAALAIAQEMDNRHIVGYCLQVLGSITFLQGDIESARRQLDEALFIARERRDAFRIAHALDWLGYVALAQGNLAEAGLLFKETASMSMELGDTVPVANALDGLGSLAAAQGNPARAFCLVGAVDAQRMNAGGGVAPVASARREPWLRLARQALGEEDVQDAWARGRAMTLEQAVAYALDDNTETTLRVCREPIFVDGARPSRASRLRPSPT